MIDQFSKNGIGGSGGRLDDDDRLEEEEKGFMDADEIEAVYADVNVDANVDTDVDEDEDELDPLKYRVRRTRAASSDSEDGDGSVDNMSEKDVCQTFLYLLIVECLG